jgi:raffinose/stachyose/melibiose transport system permease protein
MIYILPALLIYMLVTIIPVIVASYLSFFNGIGLLSKAFIGFANYKEIFTSPEFWNAFKNNILFVVFCIVGQVGIAFIL